jgi:hypothetical protein
MFPPRFLKTTGAPARSMGWYATGVSFRRSGPEGNCVNDNASVIYLVGRPID